MVIDSWVPAINIVDETVIEKGGRIMRDYKRGEKPNGYRLSTWDRLWWYLIRIHFTCLGVAFPVHGTSVYSSFRTAWYDVLMVRYGGKLIW